MSLNKCQVIMETSEDTDLLDTEPKNTILKQKILPKQIVPMKLIDTKELKKYRTLAEFEKKSFDERVKEFENLKQRYPNKIPILVSKTKTSKLNQLDLQKYLINSDLTTSTLLYVIRKRLKLAPEKAIFMFVNGTIPNSSQELSVLYQNHKSSDGFLRIE